MDAILQEVNAHIQAGETPPKLRRYRGLARLLAIAVSRCVQFLARPVTIEQRRFNQASFEAIRKLTETIRGLPELVQKLAEVTDEQAEANDQLAEKLEQTADAVSAFKDRLNRVDVVLQRQAAVLEECEAALDEQRTAWVRTVERQEEFRDSLAASAERQEEIGDSLAESAGRQEQFRDSLRSELTPLRESLAGVRTDLLLQQRRLSAALLEWRRGGSPPPQPSAPPATPCGMERLYAAFEDQFRGGRDEIKKRLLPYLPLLADRHLSSEESPILDLGCGRGEWLELLREHGLHARGVDLNEVFLEECRQRGLEVQAGDALEKLRAQPSGSLGAVTAFHLLEHLPFPVLVELLDETVRVLRPGGLALFETPNPENLLVSTYFFYADPTHRNPLFAPTLQFLAEQRGLVKVEVRPMNNALVHEMIGLGAGPPGGAESSPLLAVLARHLTAAPDYAVVGWKA